MALFLETLKAFSVIEIQIGKTRDKVFSEFSFLFISGMTKHKKLVVLF
jgi:hypothetical protein